MASLCLSSLLLLLLLFVDESLTPSTFRSSLLDFLGLQQTFFFYSAAEQQNVSDDKLPHYAPKTRFVSVPVKKKPGISSLNQMG